jgi:hypothetical protein
MPSAKGEFLAQPISRDYAASLLNVTRGRISQLISMGVLKTRDDGKFPLGKLVSDWVDYQVSQKSSARQSDDAVIRQLKIEALKFKAQEKRREIVSLSWVKDYLIDIVGRYAVRIASVPSRFTRDLKDRERLQKMIEETHAKFLADIETMIEEEGGDEEAA